MKLFERIAPAMVSTLFMALIGVAQLGCSCSPATRADMADTASQAQDKATVKWGIKRRPALKTAWRSDQGLSATDQHRIDDNCGPLGEPELGRALAGSIGPTKLVARDGYVLLHSSVEKIPLWVCEHVTKLETNGHLDRSNRFLPDPTLRPGERSELIDYKGSGYDRGHMAPAGNQNHDQELKDETFFLSNMVPQEPRLNQQIWADLENTVRGWAQNQDLYTITGPMFYDPKEEDAASANGMVEYNTIGPGEVAVPTHTYKIVVRKNGASWDCVAFVMENVNTYRRPWDLATYIVPIQEIEQRTGLNFFPKLPASERSRIKTGAGTLWP